MALPFVKYEGCGNDFIIIDNRKGFFFPKTFFSTLCHRQKGIGADGVLLLENSACADYRMRIFNSDDSEAEMCGNGIRCLAKYAHALNPAQTSFVFETMLHKIKVQLVEEEVEVEVPPPHWREGPLTLDIDSESFTLHCLDTGVPHAVLFIHENEQRAFENYAPKIRRHPHFHPKGTNVNFVKNCESHLSLRTYERGVEQETLACGTGAVAVALAAAKLNLLSSPIKVMPRSGDLLTVSFRRSGKEFLEIRLQGPARNVFQGIWIMG